jgi:hypothetical protein
LPAIRTASWTASHIALLGWALIATGALADGLADQPRIGLLGVPLAAGLVALVALPVLEASARGGARAVRAPMGLIRLSAVVGAGISAGVAYGGLVGGFELESVLVCLGGLVTVLATDVPDGP